MTTTTTTLSDFLLARMVEDETEIGLSIYGHDSSAGPNGIGWAEVGAISEVLMISHRRALAECAAKRAIADLHRPQFLDLGDADGMDRSGYYCETCDDLPESIWPCATVRHLAAVYTDHADYDPSWAVS